MRGIPLVKRYPDIAEMYSPNNEIDLAFVTAGSSLKALWVCQKCGVDFPRRVSHMVNQKYRFCPDCRKDVASRIISGITKVVSDFSNVLIDWNFEKNILDPGKVAAGSNSKFFWKCHQCNYEWETSAAHRCYSQTGCPACAKRIRGNTRTLSSAKNSKSLQDAYPEIADEWDYSKNTLFSPQTVPYRCNRKFWFICKSGHSYDASVNHRTNGRGCPYCANRKLLSGFNDFSTIFPKIALQWDESNILKPSEILAYSNKLFTWKCDLGHLFTQSCNDRAHGRGCPVCASKKVICGYNDFFSKRPDIARTWHPTNNGVITPQSVTLYSNKAVWWRCDICNFEWKAAPNVRVRCGCKKCSKIGESIPEYILLFYLKQKFPDVIHHYLPDFLLGKEVDIFIPSLNTAIEYDGIAWHKNIEKDKAKSKLLFDNNIPLIRLREIGLPLLDSSEIIIYVDYKNLPDYKWLEKPVKNLMHYLNASDIKIDIENDLLKILDLRKSSFINNSVSRKCPELLPEWDYEANGNLSPSQIRSGSNIKVHWKCILGHQWKAAVNSRVNGCGCPFCANQKVLSGFNDLLTTYPEIAKEWSERNQLSPSEILCHSNKKAFFICSECGFEYSAAISSRTLQKTGCPKCGRKKCSSNKRITHAKNNPLSSKYPDIAMEWNYENNGSMTPENFSAGSGQSVWWKCTQCGNEWKTSICNRTNGGTGCPICAKNHRR